MRPTVIPKWLLKKERITGREWRQRKRKELRAVLKLTDRLKIGCAYTPCVDGEGIGKAINTLQKFERAWSQKEWGK